MRKLLGRESLIATDTRVCQAGARERYLVTTMWIANTDGSARTIRLHHLIGVRGESAAVSNSIFYDVSFAANSTMLVQGTVEEPLFVLEATDMLVGRASTAGVVTITLYGEKEPAR